MEASPEGASAASGPKAPPLDTLAQLDQSRAGADDGKLLRRARAKYITVPLAIQLAELRSPLEKSYRNTFYCAGTLEQDEDGKIRGTYCGNRWCSVCNRVRIARAINRYLPVIKAWEDTQLVTLTLPNVSAEKLAETMDIMLRDVKTIGRALRRTDRLALRALRKLECTYNPERDDYHPHFHLAVEGKAAAQAFLKRWLKIHPLATRSAQDIRPCDDGSLKELFKYFTKLITKRINRQGSRSFAPGLALDVIFCAMRGRRVFQPMGFKVAAAECQDENAQVGTEGDTVLTNGLGRQIVWEWLQEPHDWVDLSTGELLTGYEPTQPLRELVEKLPGMSRYLGQQ